MSDVDYQKLFENGQLIWQESSHKALLDQMYRGAPDAPIFRAKYQDYMKNCHPEAPVTIGTVLPMVEAPKPEPVVAPVVEPVPPEMNPNVSPVDESSDLSADPFAVDSPVGFLPKKRGRPAKVPDPTPV